MIEENESSDLRLKRKILARFLDISEKGVNLKANNKCYLVDLFIELLRCCSFLAKKDLIKGF
jgi:hypothetical protein